MQLPQGPDTLKLSSLHNSVEWGGGWGLSGETKLPLVLSSSLYYKKEQ